jgi:hypothetical protein
MAMDDYNRELATRRIIDLDAVEGPRVGDFVRYENGRMERVSHIWDFTDEDPSFVPQAQTSESGSFYLGHGYVSFSGGLNPGVKVSELRLTDEKKLGSVWMFNHDVRRAHNGVDFNIEFRVYEVVR